jgi:hypothetical protein
MHDEHRRQHHLCPSHNDHKQCRRNGLLHHVVSVWQINASWAVTPITRFWVTQTFLQMSCKTFPQTARAIPPGSPAPPATRENETYIR